MRTSITMQQVAAVAAMLSDHCGDDDEKLVLDTLEGETDLFETVGKLLNAIERDEGNKAALVAQVQDRNERKARADHRIVGYRDAISALMECAGIDKLPLPEATVTLRQVAPKLIVTDLDALPDALCRITRKPDMAAIKSAVSDTALPGTSFDNGGVSLTIRRR